MGARAEISAELVRAARAALPLEACGLVAGPRGTGRLGRLELFPLRNAAATPRRAFRLDSAELAAALAALDSAGLAVVAVYHSHPDGPAELSAEDQAGLRFEGGASLPGADAVVIDARGGAVRWFRFDGRAGRYVRRRDG